MQQTKRTDIQLLKYAPERNKTSVKTKVATYSQITIP